jgi:hypothetical protein
MLKADLFGMQGLAGEDAQVALQGRVAREVPRSRAIHRIPQHRMSYMRQVDANLVRATGL